MDEQFDNELKNKISKMFENFEHSSVDKGWLRLQEKFPETGKNRGVNWLWAGSAAAAILFVFFGVNRVVRHQEGVTKRLSQKNINHYDHQNKISAQNKQGVDTVSSSSQTAVAKNPVVDKVLPRTNSKLLAKKQLSKNQTPSPRGNNRLMVKTQSIKNRPAKTQTVKTDNEGFLSSLNTKEDVSIGQTIDTADKLTSIKNTNISKTIAKGVMASSSVADDDTVAKTQSLITLQKRTAKPRKNIEKDKKKIEFGIYAATYFNYSPGSTVKLNVGAGVTADIRLFKNLKLSTGLAVAQNTLDYGNQLPNLISVVNTGAALAFNFLQQNSAATSGVTYSLLLKNYTAQLVGLDVPLNLKYEFNSQKNYSYFSMGLSSGAFIYQSYTYQYNYSSRPVQTMATSAGLNGFYFAKTLNAAFGLGYPVGKTNRLFIEPFFKYPLSGLGSEGIRFGASGINLKFDFQSPKK